MGMTVIVRREGKSDWRRNKLPSFPLGIISMIVSGFRSVIPKTRKRGIGKYGNVMWSKKMNDDPYISVYRLKSSNLRTSKQSIKKFNTHISNSVLFPLNFKGLNESMECMECYADVSQGRMTVTELSARWRYPLRSHKARSYKRQTKNANSCFNQKTTTQSII